MTELGVNFFTGVPDSILKNICNTFAAYANAGQHIVAANEGNAVALAAGHYLATGNFGLVYMQNSGLGNALNPLVSLADPMVYGIPVLLLIGWRGEPTVKDEPQHSKQGMITLQLLETMGIKYIILPDSDEGVINSIDQALKLMKSCNESFALVVRANTFENDDANFWGENNYTLTREEAVGIILSQMPYEDVLVSSTGKLSREIFEYRAKMKESHQRDFLNVGSMGHASQIALGIALRQPGRVVYCLDGDGAALMHMGAMAIIGNCKPSNFKHIIFNNGAHDSVGGLATVGHGIDFPMIAKACGYINAMRAVSKTELINQLKIFQEKNNGPALLEIRIRKGSREDLGRPTIAPQENKSSFMNHLSI